MNEVLGNLKGPRRGRVRAETKAHGESIARPEPEGGETSEAACGVKGQEKRAWSRDLRRMT
eukprot:3718503-Rhodomonas_salina.2